MLHDRIQSGERLKSYSLRLLKRQQGNDDQQVHKDRCNLPTSNEIAAISDDNDDGCPPANRNNMKIHSKDL